MPPLESILTASAICSHFLMISEADLAPTDTTRLSPFFFWRAFIVERNEIEKLLPTIKTNLAGTYPKFPPFCAFYKRFLKRE